MKYSCTTFIILWFSSPVTRNTKDTWIQTQDCNESPTWNSHATIGASGWRSDMACPCSPVPETVHKVRNFVKSRVVSTNHIYRILSLEFEAIYPNSIYLQIIENTFLYSVSSTKLHVFFEFAATLGITNLISQIKEWGSSFCFIFASFNFFKWNTGLKMLFTFQDL